MIKINEKEFRKVCETSISMSQAASKLNLHFNTFKRYAVKFGCYNPNQGLCGGKRGRYINRIPTEEILAGKHPQYQTFKLRKRLLDENIKSNRCEICGIEDWNGNPISMELDHINGNSYDHSLENLRMICPNCHSQTPTFRSKNCNRKTDKCKVPKEKKRNKCSDCDIIISRKATRCKSCAQKINRHRKVKNRPSKEILLQEIEENGYSATGRKYGVSDNAVRKWLK